MPMASKQPEKVTFGSRFAYSITSTIYILDIETFADDTAEAEIQATHFNKT